MKDACLHTELHILLDASTSMTPIRRAALDGVNAFLKEQQAVEGQVWVSLTTFHHLIRTVWDRIPLQEVLPLKLQDYPLQGGTRLYDTLCAQMDIVRHREREAEKKSKPFSVIFLIVTDGWDRGSQVYSDQDAQDRMAASRDKGWNVLLLGSGRDFVPMAELLEIPEQNRMPFEHSSKGIERGMHQASCTVTRLRTIPQRSCTPIEPTIKTPNPDIS